MESIAIKIVGYVILSVVVQKCGVVFLVTVVKRVVSLDPVNNGF